MSDGPDWERQYISEQQGYHSLFYGEKPCMQQCTRSGKPGGELRRETQNNDRQGLNRHELKGDMTGECGIHLLEKAYKRQYKYQGVNGQHPHEDVDDSGRQGFLNFTRQLGEF